MAPSAGSRDDDDAGWDEGPIGGDEDDARWGGAPTKSREDDGDDWFGSMTSMDVDAYGDVMMGGKRSSGSTASSAADDIIDGANDWFNNNDDWFEPQYKEVNAPPGTMLEKVQRMTLNEPSDFSFKDGEYFDLMGYVKHKTDNEFCLVLEVAERARERKLERSESLSGTGPRLPPIQQAIADLALEIELSGGKTSAYLAMREAADRARLRYELQQASWCWDKYSEDSMRALGVSEKAEQMLHQGERIDEAMDFERELMIEDMNDSGTRRF